MGYCNGNWFSDYIKFKAASGEQRDVQPWANQNTEGADTTFRWNSGLYPMATIEHVGSSGQKSVLALQARGGQVVMKTSHLPAGGVFEIGLSDGLNVQTLTLFR